MVSGTSKSMRGGELGKKLSIRFCQYCNKDFVHEDPAVAEVQRGNHESVCMSNPNR